MTSRNWKLANKRFLAGLKQVPCQLLSADRIRAIANNDSLVELFGSAHAVGHRIGKGVDAAADALKIDDDDVDVFQHPFRRLARLAIKRINWNVSLTIDSVRCLDHVVLHVAANSVLWSEQSREVNSRMIVKQIGSVTKRMID